VDVSRISTGVPILHPQIFSFRFPLKGIGADQEIFVPVKVDEKIG